MYSDEEFFVWDMDSLRSILGNPTPRNLLDASGILRRLMVDGSNSILQKVAKKFDYKPRFQIGVDFNEMIEEVNKITHGGMLQAWVNPRVWSSAGGRQVSLDEFLACPVHWAQGTNITIKEIITYVANVAGGVHKGEPRRKDNAQTIHAIANSLIINGKPLPIESVQPIATIVVAALAPLYQRIRS